MTGINILAELSKPFQDHEIEWRAQTFTEKNGIVRALMLPYIDSRAAMQRLDDVLGVNWKDDYTKMEINGQQAFQCSISIYDGGQWITRTDGAECTDIESVKGGFSAAFKRAAVKFGIGRYLYDMNAQWCTVEQRGNQFVKGKISGQNGHVVQGYITPPSITQIIQNGGKQNRPPQTQGQQNHQQSQAPQQGNPNAQKAVQILNGLIEKLKFGSNIIPYLLERAGSQATKFEQATSTENETVYHALKAVDSYLDTCRNNTLPLEKVIYYAQIVGKKQFNTVGEMVFELDYETVNQAIELIHSDLGQQATA